MLSPITLNIRKQILATGEKYELHFYGTWFAKSQNPPNQRKLPSVQPRSSRTAVAELPRLFPSAEIPFPLKWGSLSGCRVRGSGLRELQCRAGGSPVQLEHGVEKSRPRCTSVSSSPHSTIFRGCGRPRSEALSPRPNGKLIAALGTDPVSSDSHPLIESHLLIAIYL